MLRSPRIPWLVGFASLLLSKCHAIQYDISTPTQCGPLEVTWNQKQGNEDMRLLIMPALETFETNAYIDNIVIPDNENGSYIIPQFAQPGGTTFIAALIDQGGYAATGATQVLTVGSSDSSGCLPTTIPTTNFFFYTDTTTPSQCGNVGITWQNSYTVPASIEAIIPGGQIWSLHNVTEPNQGGGEGAPGDGYDWQVNIKSGSRVVLYMNDGNGGTGGSTTLWTVQGSSDSACLNEASPASITSGGPGQETITGQGGSGGQSTGRSEPSSTSDSSSSGGSTTNVGAIVGGVVGGVVALLLILLALLLCLRRRARQVRDPQHARSTLLGSVEKRRPSHHTDSSCDVVQDVNRKSRTSVIDLLAGEPKVRSSMVMDPQGSPYHASQGTPESESDGATFVPSPYPLGLLDTPNSPTTQRAGMSEHVQSQSNLGRISSEMGASEDERVLLGGGGGVHRRSDAGTHSDQTISEERPDELTTIEGARTRTSSVPSVPAPAAALRPDMALESQVSHETLAGRSLSTRKRRPVTNELEHGTTNAPPRFILHQDAGMVEDAEPSQSEEAVVEMPPRYDQLQSVNK